MDHSQHAAVDASTPWFSQDGFMPHGHCYLWQPALVWTHVISDLLVGLAYLLISAVLYRLVRKIQLPFSGMFLAFGAFIGFCGLTHFMEILTLWHAYYWASGFVKAITAVASVATGIVLLTIGPQIVLVAQAAKLSQQRKIELESANKKLEVLYAKVKEADEVKTQFFANVSHELRTPLALILGPAANLMNNEKLDSESRHSVDVIIRNARMLLKHVNDLLDISKLEAGRMRPRYSHVDLVRLMRVTAAYFEPLMQSKNIFFSLQTPDALDVEIDGEKMQRVFINLMSNAVKFTPDGGRIWVTIESPNGKVVCTVSDTGRGVKPEMREAIFERFQQGEAGINRVFGGTGLGLTIVKNFVEMHGGSVRLADSVSPGATFVVEFPKKAPPHVEVHTTTEDIKFDDVAVSGVMEEFRQIAATGQKELDISGKPVVLVCEDNPDMNRFITDTLGPHFLVLTAFDGRDGLAKAIARKPDVIVSDIMMPYMGGDELLQALRKHPDLQETPVLLLSARADDELRIRLLREGANDYVVKPFHSAELLARLRNLLVLKKTRDVLEIELSTKSHDLVALAKDVAFKKREAELAKETAEVARLQAEKASQVRSTFLTLVSHELNTPLTSQYLTLQTLTSARSDNLTDKQKRMVERLLTSSRQLKELVESLIEYTRIESGRLPVLPESIDLQALTREVLDDVGALAAKKDLTIEVETAPNLGVLVSDYKLVRMVMSNLLINAIKFTDVGTIKVDIERAPTHHRISVRDTGHGISTDDQRRIFDPFEQLEPLSQKSTAGIGLGLALVKEIMSALGGDIRVESELGRGSTFYVDFPPLEKEFSGLQLGTSTTTTSRTV